MKQFMTLGQKLHLLCTISIILNSSAKKKKQTSNFHKAGVKKKPWCTFTIQYHFFDRSYASCADSDSNPQPCERLGFVIGGFTRSATDFPLLNYVFRRHICLMHLIGQEFRTKTASQPIRDEYSNVAHDY